MNAALTAVLDEILPNVEKPSRYLGNEVNAVRKDPATVDVRLVFAFPDLYDLGLGNLGLHILYACVNNVPWAAAERVYAPAVDMERELRKRDLPLFALESKIPVADFDMLGFTLQTELTYTNILNMIDLARIPVRSKDRTDAHPIVFAGGPAVFNPEPLANFIDFFVVGDGEDAVVEIVNVMRAMKGQPRRTKLLALSRLEGVYVPALYPFDTMPDGRILPRPGAPKIRKRITRDLDGATYPVNYIVPYTRQVHDRLSLEVLRGCTQGCRFCQAGMVTRPVRERKLENLDTLMQRLIDTTGYEEVSLVSLSTCDYSRVRKLVEQTVERARPQHVSVSLPSLRLDSYSVELSDMVAETRKTGVTFAPEAASPRLRSVINKWIPDEELLNMSAEVFARGWDVVKLYFMIGLPTERDDDILAIADLARRTYAKGRAINKNARVNLGVSTFVPKPFTPFQWAAQIRPEETERRQSLLLQAIKDVPAIKFGRHSPEETYLEGLLSRGDRRAGDLIEAAWKLGCRFDAWREHLRMDLWHQAVTDTGYSVEEALRERSVDEPLPWDHLDMFIPKEWFVADWQRAMELKHAEDCRHKRCHKCGVIDEVRDLCASMLRDNVAGRKFEKVWVDEHKDEDGKVRPKFEERVEPRPVQRLWIRIGRTGSARFLSHLEAMNAWMRSLRRAHAPLAWSQGFHPHARFAFDTATATGEETVAGLMDILLVETVDPAVLVDRLASLLPEGFSALSAREVPLNAPSLMSVTRGGSYTLWFAGTTADELRAKVDALLARDAILMKRTGKVKGKKREIQVDIRPMIKSLTVRDGETPSVDVVLEDQGRKLAKAGEIARLLSDKPDQVRILKREVLLLDESRWAEAGQFEGEGEPAAEADAG